jgi:extracellular factor (EF) 3-hydroxypalmitic acid methyl ester biosynthesis protein
MLYLNDYQGNSTFAKLFHKHGVEHSASQSVRNRILLIADTLRNYQATAELSSPNKIKVLSAGSGSAFELQDILKSSRDCENYHFTLLDQDPISLSEAADLIGRIEKKFDCKIDVSYQAYSVRKMIFAKRIEQKMGQFDFIYSMGLFDYLAAPVAKAVFKRLYQLLKPGGKMVIGNFHVSNPSKYYMDYWCDWVLFHRTEEELMNLLDERNSMDVEVLYEDTGSQMFLNLKKPENYL